MAQSVADAMNDLLWLHQHGAGEGVMKIISERRQLAESGLPPDLNKAALLESAAGAYMVEHDTVKADTADQLARAGALEAAEIDRLTEGR